MMDLLGRLGSGEPVFDRPNTHLHQGVLALLPEALGRVNLNGDTFAVVEVDFGRVVGETMCVETSGSDQIVFAKRPKRFGYSRFVRNRNPEPCSSVVVILKKDEVEDYYVLITAFVGRRPQPEPWDRNATPDSAAFWSSHALVWGSEPIIPGSETNHCPW